MSGLEGLCPHLSGPPLVAALAGFGFAVGILTGLFGVGGGFLVVPMLHLLFGIDMPVAIGSSLAFIIGTAAAGTARHARLGHVERRTTLIVACGGVCGALLGALLVDALKARFGGDGGQRLNAILEVPFIPVLLLTSFLVARGSDRGCTGPAGLQRLPLGPRVDLPGADLRGVSLPGLVGVGLGIGLLGGLMGIGGGVLFVPLLILLVGLAPHQAVGTSLGVVLLSSISGTIEHGLAGRVSLALTMVLLVGSTLGVQLGAGVCRRLGGRQLRQYFAVLMFLTAVALAADLVVKLIG